MLKQEETTNPVLFYFKLATLLFWSGWFAIACTTNITDFLNSMNIVNFVSFKSNNLMFVRSVMGMFSFSPFVINLCFVLIILVEASISILFLRAAFNYKKYQSFSNEILFAFAISMGLWAVFMLMDELFIAYGFESTHARLLILEFISLYWMKYF